MLTRADSNGAPSSGRSWLGLVTKILVSAALLAFLLSRVDMARLWRLAQQASFAWLVVALAVYFVVIALSTWRWQLLLAAQRIRVPGQRLLSSYLVATFFNNFLPSNIGGDVIRIRDTAAPAGSKTLATTIVLADRAIGLAGLVAVAAVGATVVQTVLGTDAPVWPGVLWAALLLAAVVAVPALLAPDRLGRLAHPLRIFHPEWVDERIGRVTDALSRFRQHPRALVECFVGAIGVQALLVLFYVVIARSMHIPIQSWHLAVVVPISFVVQMLPISLNGFGVREATFVFYFSRLGLSTESALLVSFAAVAVIMVFSLSGVPVLLARQN